MAQQHINQGTPPAGTDGDTNAAAWTKAEANFTELYATDALKFDKAGGTISGNTTIVGVASIQRPSVPAQVFSTNIDAAGNAFNSYSSVGGAKALIFNSTTDVSNTPATGGSIGVKLATYGVTRWTVDGAALYPEGDNSYSVGISSKRASVVYAATGTINTSDAREKTAVAPLTDAELAAASDLSRAIGTYQWLSSIDAKGADKARHHAGLTVQRAIEIMQAHGLDPMRYGFICYDQWPEQPEIRDEATGDVVQECIAAGDRYSFRMDEMLAFIARGFAARLDALEAAAGA